MGRELSELEQEFYSDILTEETPPADVPTPDSPVAVIPEETPKPDPIPDAPVIDTPDPPYKSKKFVAVEDEKELYQTLEKKYGATRMSADEKAISFIKQQNPELDDDEIAFMAMSDYGIGLDKPSDDELTDEQKIALRKQDIAKKKLITQADNFFKQEADKIALPDYDPLDLDPDYKKYRTDRQIQEAERVDKEARTQNIIQSLETNSKTISDIKEMVEIDLDEGKLAIEVNFKLNPEKQQQLADFAKRYTPTQAEYDAHFDPATGKFDYPGYLKDLAPIAFAKDINKAGMRQALAKDREKFIEKELKNSTLRNNDVSVTVDKPFDIVDAWPFGR